MALPTANGSDDLSKEPDPSHLEQWLPPDKPFLDAWLARSTELVDKYHPDFVYFDWWIGQPTFKPYLQRFASYYYDRSAEWNAQPVLTYKEESMPANVATLDIERGKLDTLRLLPWQTDTSVSIHSWGYVEHDEYRTAPSLIEQLLDTVSKNGNLLLNVGPKADGTIPEEAAGILRQMGSWLRMNGAAIYGSRPFTVFGEGPTKADKNSTQMHHDIQTYTSDDVRYTTNDDPSHKGSRVLYASLMQRPASGSSTLHVLFRGNPYLDADVCSVHSLAGEGALPFIQDEGGLKVTLPSAVSGDSLSGFPVVLAIRTDCRGK
jgi:alpha-L-fucosidase